jgi:hypothetical protein
MYTKYSYLHISESVSMKSKSYRELAADIIAKDGWGGLFGRGLQVSVYAYGQHTLYVYIDRCLSLQFVYLYVCVD